MNAFSLTNEAMGAKAWACGWCRRICVDLADAERCCTCMYCGDPHSTEKPLYGAAHQDCRTAHYAACDAKRLEEAEIVEDYAGPVYVGDTYYTTAEEAIEALESDDADVPEFAHCCTVTPVIDDAVLERMIDGIVDDWGMEDASADDLTIPESLTAAWAEFIEANRANVTWSANWKRKTRLR